MKYYTTKDIAAECGVREQTIVSFIKYRMEANLEVPDPVPYQWLQNAFPDSSRLQ